MNLLYIKSFNNYYNRRVKYFRNLEEYTSNYDTFLYTGQDFNPNDGVSTSRYVNWSEEWNPDYLLVINDENKIVSRWFVMEMRRTRSAQYTIILRRDLIADHYDVLMDAPMYVEKGRVDVLNPLIYNKENAAFNQIKKQEILLEDESKTAWIVGYILKDAIDQNTSITYNVQGNKPTIESLDFILNNPLNPEEGAKLIVYDNIFLSILINNFGGSRFRYAVDALNLDSLTVSKDEYSDTYPRLSTKAFSQLISEYGTTWKNKMKSFEDDINLKLHDYFESKDKKFISSQEYQEDYLSKTNQIFYSITTGKTYKMVIQGSSAISDNFSFRYLSDDNALPMFSIMNQATMQTADTYPSELYYYDFDGTSWRDAGYYCKTKGREINVYFKEITDPEALSVELKANHRHTDDAIYDIFALPYSLENLTLAQEISRTLTNAKILDLQILPYCPMRLYWSNGNPYLSELSVDIDYSLISNGDPLLWCPLSSFNKFIYKSIPLLSSNDAIEMKVQNECYLYRLVSPNYNGAFEFSVAKNGGVDSFEVSATYKPFSPFILVNPTFKNLYGNDFDDARGMICNGDFSVATLTSAWETFEVQNKNYQNIFNAEIKTLDKNNRLNIIQQLISSPLQAIGTGAAVGTLSKNAVAGVGAAVGSLAAGVADIAIGQSRFQNERQLKQDLFEYNLQNIQARPDTLNKISAYNINNKFFPFVEIYESTEEEKEWFRKKLKYEGMSIGVISTMREFINDQIDINYFKGRLVILDGISEDYHVIDALGVELEKGVYL